MVSATRCGLAFLLAVASGFVGYCVWSQTEAPSLLGAFSEGTFVSADRLRAAASQDVRSATPFSASSSPPSPSSPLALPPSAPAVPAAQPKTTTTAKSIPTTTGEPVLTTEAWKLPDASIFDRWATDNAWLPLIVAVQEDCALTSDDVPLSPGGGFASKFQLVTAKAMKALKKGHAFRLMGHFAGYTKMDYCQKTLGKETFDKKGSYACFFKPESSCQDGSSRSDSGSGSSAEARKRFQGLTKVEEGQLFQAIESYIFRMNDKTIASIREREKKVGFSEEQRRPLVAIHARRGDKVVDSYNRYYTTREYAQAVFTWANKAEECQASDETSQPEQRQQQEQEQQQQQQQTQQQQAKQSRRPPRFVQVYVASDSALVLGEMETLVGHVRAGGCRFQVIGNRNSVTQTVMDGHQFDGRNEYQGMAGKVERLKGDEAREATIDILFDIYMISRANFMVGTLTSQIGRIGAGLKLAVNFPSTKGAPPVALDYPNWRSVEGMGGGDGIPSPLTELWTQQPPQDRSLDAAPGSLPLPPVVAPEFEEVYRSILSVQNDCDRSETIVETDGRQGSDLATLLRDSAVRAAKALREGGRVVFHGTFNFYGKSQVCQELVGKALYDNVGTFRCFFLPESSCPLDGSSVGPSKSSEGALQVIQSASDLDLTATTLAFLMRFTEETKAELMKRDWIARVVGLPPPVVGVEVIGEKAASLLGVPPESPASYAQAIPRLLDSQTWREKFAKLENFAKSPKPVCTVVVTSDGDEALQELIKSLDGKNAGPCTMAVTGLQGHFAHHHFKEGWGGKLNNADGRWATRDMLFDLDLLSRADLLLGSASSPAIQLGAELRYAKRGKAIALSSAYQIASAEQKADATTFPVLWTSADP